MSARIGRYAGAIVVEEDGQQILVGNPKEPCAAVPETLEAPFVKRLDAPVPLSGCVLLVERADPAVISQRLVIQRNGSVSERLWRLVTNRQSTGELPAQWLVDMPAHVWGVVRDAVLKCS